MDTDTAHLRAHRRSDDDGKTHDENVLSSSRASVASVEAFDLLMMLGALIHIYS